VEREWWIDEEGTAYIVDLALPVEGAWLPVTYGDRPAATGGLRFAGRGRARCLPAGGTGQAAGVVTQIGSKREKPRRVRRGVGVTQLALHLQREG
jgi:hypothetical protein